MKYSYPYKINLFRIIQKDNAHFTYLYCSPDKKTSPEHLYSVPIKYKLINEKIINNDFELNEFMKNSEKKKFEIKNF
jgi:hypothetical protein